MIRRKKNEKQRKSSFRLFVNRVTCTVLILHQSQAEAVGALQNEGSVRFSDVLLRRYVKFNVKGVYSGENSVFFLINNIGQRFTCTRL